MVEDLDEQVAAFRHRRLDEAGPFTFVTADALPIKVRENKQVVRASVLLAEGRRLTRSAPTPRNYSLRNHLLPIAPAPP